MSHATSQDKARDKCRYCGRPFPVWSPTAGFCGGTCAALHRIRRLEGPAQAEQARRRWAKEPQTKEPILVEGESNG